MEDAERFGAGEKIFKFINQVLKRKVIGSVHRSSLWSRIVTSQGYAIFPLPFLDSIQKGSILEAHTVLKHCVWWRLD